MANKELKVIFSGETGNFDAAVNRVSNGLNKAGAAAGKSKTDLTNFSRVIQDLPFGFIGIQNNLTQLIPGVGALGLVFSGLIAAITFSKTGLRNWGVAAKDTGDEAEETKFKVKSLNAIFSDTTGATQGSIASVNALAKVLNDTNESYETRKRALGELQKVNKSYFGDLSVEKSTYTDIANAVNGYSEAIIKQAQVKGLTDEISRQTAELHKQERTLKPLTESYRAAGRSADDFTISMKGVVLPFTNTSASPIVNQSEVAKKAYLGQKAVVDSLKGSLKDLSNAVNENTSDFLKLKPLDDPDTAKPLKIKKVKIDPDIKKIEEELDALHYKIQASLYDAVPVIIPTKLELIDRDAALKVDLDKDPGEIFKGQTEIVKEYASAYSDYLAPAINSVFDSLKNGQNVFAGIGQALVGLIEKLVATVIQAAILSVILNVLFPGGGSAIGGYGLKNLFGMLNGLPHLAHGGVVTKPTLALIGEQGAEG